MLSSLPGDAITSIKIDGVAHEFQKIDGVIEDVTAIVLNVKSIVLKNHSMEEKGFQITSVISQLHSSTLMATCANSPVSIVLQKI